ncbi:hypothetical protein V495_04023 [Pseudogymnoascus sp. VKM F-4514 (FW-929)]|nr:hypothetical protein V495_04023 [Pseudogymnoascus sp. VKM F-4514 (FW-929)]KFY53981.1 hypothetical protein V497_08077 [Pseudogymnoascus sp. VKM F-4516 (FW-969)]
MSTQAQGRKIAIIGASGQLGKPMVKALLAQRVHTITVVQRPDSTSSFPSEVTLKKGDLEDEAFLADAFKGQDAIVLMPPLSHIISLQKPAVRAAASVGVRWILPSEFGPDPFASKLIEENSLLKNKKEIRDLIDELGVSSWVSIAVGPWLDVNLTLGLWGIDPKARKATIWRGANAKTNTTTVAHTGEVAAAVLSLPEADLAKYKNKAVYAPSFHLSQREILEAVQRATGTTNADWDVTTREYNDVASEYESNIKKGDGMAPFIKFFVTHFVEGLGGDFDHKVDKAELEKLEKLGLPKDNLEEVIKAALQ